MPLGIVVGRKFMRDQIFISYSHADSDYQLRLRTHLSIFERSGSVKYWSDTQLRTGDQWRNEIENNLEKTAVAILLVSADFLDSDFIRSNELPPLLDAWEKECVYILPVIVKPCSFSHVTELSRFQAVNDPEYTVAEMNDAERERTWKNLAEIAYRRLLEYQEKHPEPPVSDFEQGRPSSSSFIDLSDLIDIHIEVEEEPQKPQKKHEPDVTSHEQEDDLLFYYVHDLLEDPSRLQSYYVYTYEHIDILSFLPSAIDFLSAYGGCPALIHQVEELFRQNGWEGDGEIRLMWFPPFLRIGVEDTWGTLAWFVKQNNNGTSFIASPATIPYLTLPNPQILTPDADGYYTAQIAEVRRKINPQYRCFKLRGLLDQVSKYKEDETHWLLYHTGDFQDPSVNDWVRFKVKTVCGLRDFPDIQNTRNIYLYSLEILP